MNPPTPNSEAPQAHALRLMMDRDETVFAVPAAWTGRRWAVGGRAHIGGLELLHEAEDGGRIAVNTLDDPAEFPTEILLYEYKFEMAMELLWGGSRNLWPHLSGKRDHLSGADRDRIWRELWDREWGSCSIAVDGKHVEFRLLEFEDVWYAYAQTPNAILVRGYDAELDTVELHRLTDPDEYVAAAQEEWDEMMSKLDIGSDNHRPRETEDSLDAPIMTVYGLDAAEHVPRRVAGCGTSGPVDRAPYAITKIGIVYGSPWRARTGDDWWAVVLNFDGEGSWNAKVALSWHHDDWPDVNDSDNSEYWDHVSEFADNTRLSGILFEHAPSTTESIDVDGAAVDFEIIRKGAAWKSIGSHDGTTVVIIAWQVQPADLKLVAVPNVTAHVEAAPEPELLDRTKVPRGSTVAVLVSSSGPWFVEPRSPMQTLRDSEQEVLGIAAKIMMSLQHAKPADVAEYMARPILDAHGGPDGFTTALTELLDRRPLASVWLSGTAEEIVKEGTVHGVTLMWCCAEDGEGQHDCALEFVREGERFVLRSDLVAVMRQ